MRMITLVVLVGCSSQAASEPPDASPAADHDAQPVGAEVHCTGKATQKLDDVWTVESGGLTRTVLVHVPASYDPTSGTPLVLDFHGFTSDAPQEQVLSGMPAKADAEGFITMHPNGIGSPRSFNAGACCGYAAASEVDDVLFARALLDEAAARLCIDPARIFATGMSNGGFMSHRLACELADRIAAVAPVSGTLGITTCAPSRPIPIIMFNGTADDLVPYGGNPSYGFPAIPETFAGWAARNGCTGTPVETFAQGDARCETYESCTAGAHVTQCTITGGGHAWPGGFPIPGEMTSTDLSATDAMWEFFAAHPITD